MALGQFELALRVAAGLFVVVAPTLLFLALWRGLEAMRDDELVQRARRRVESTDSAGSEWRVDVAALSGGSTGDPAPDRTVSCNSCGTRNRPAVTYCRNCLERLGD